MNESPANEPGPRVRIASTRKQLTALAVLPGRVVGLRIGTPRLRHPRLRRLSPEVGREAP